MSAFVEKIRLRAIDFWWDWGDTIIPLLVGAYLAHVLTANGIKLW